jgi:mRNA interferase RelE/StbE
LVYKISYKKSVQQDLKHLDKTEARRVLDKIEKNLRTKAASYSALKGEFAGLRKYRAGNYRVIFSIVGEDVLVLRIAHRKDVYR